MEAPSFLRRKRPVILLGTVVLLGLYATRLYSYLLFHVLAELFVVVVACSIFLVAWNGRRTQDNHYFLFIGIGYLFSGALDILHMLGYKGMGVFPAYDANLGTQLWVGARYLQAISLLVAPRFADHALSPGFALAGFATAASLIIASVFSGVFPDCYIEGAGLTPFKIYSEYAICAILFASIFHLNAKRGFFERDVPRTMAFSIVVAIGSEYMFTLSRDLDGLSNIFGHYLKILSFFLIYRALIGIDLVRRLELTRRLQGEVDERKRAEEELRASKEGLEQRVAERTAELSALASRLQEELAERRRAQEDLRQSEERFRAVVERSPVGIFIVRDGRIVYQNPEQSRLFGPMPEDFDFRTFRDVHPEDAARFGELVDLIAAGGEPAYGTDLRFYPYGKSADGVDLRWVHVTTIPMEYGGEKSVLVRMADITQLKEMEYQYLLREKMASLGHVAAGIAHEIRNPLSGINIHLSALERMHEEADGLGAEGREQAAKVVRQIQSASDRIESVIRKVMEFSRPSAPQMEPADVCQAIESAIDFTVTQLRKERIALDRSGLGELPKCRVDLPLITQVVMNLIVNAAQALERSEGEKIIGLSSRAEGDRIVVCVSDSGPGIPAAIRDRIFDPFFTTRKDGYGIGLSFCQRVISEHGGTLTVGSCKLGGAEFLIELPVEPAHKAVSVGTP